VTLSRYVRPTKLTRAAALVSACTIALTAGFLIERYDSLPDLLVVHFMRNGFPNGWQYKTWGRVLVPVFVQLALVATLGVIAALLLSRPRGPSASDPRVSDTDTDDMRAAATAAEAVTLLASIWIVVQAYAAFALARLWQQARPMPRLDGYTVAELVGLVLTVVVAVRAHLRLGRPEPRPFVPEHWRFGQLYKNPDDPALFVPTRNGARWTLNFGRPMAAALIGVVLFIGIVGPAVILALSLR
jgi:uncharacterized membrane protein